MTFPIHTANSSIIGPIISIATLALATTSESSAQGTPKTTEVAIAPEKPETTADEDVFGSGSNRFAINFVTIGNPGNKVDDTGYGAVGYVYRIGTHEISKDMVVKADKDGGLGITLVAEGVDFDSAFTAEDMDRPATFISWNKAARFVNWLNKSAGGTLAYKFTSQPGDADYNPDEDISLWQPDDEGYDPKNLFRNSNARYFIPSEDEWYKAAYYDPNANNGAGAYWDYATGSDTEPIPVAGGTKPGTAVYLQPNRGDNAHIRNAGGLSPYGTMAQNGNVREICESAYAPPNDDPTKTRAGRDAPWFFKAMVFKNSSRNKKERATGNYPDGFRVAASPAP
jgi:hypothetical protein